MQTIKFVDHNNDVDYDDYLTFDGQTITPHGNLAAGFLNNATLRARYDQNTNDPKVIWDNINGHSNGYVKATLVG